MTQLYGIVSNGGKVIGSSLEKRGLKGETGDKGDTGDSATIAVGTVTTGNAGTSAAITNSGDEHNAVFNFTIPKGDKGDTGAKGDVNTYIAMYGTTSYSDIGTAISAGKYVVAKYNNDYYPLIMFSNSSYVFSYIHENICYEVVCDSSSVWTARTHTSVRDVKQNNVSVTTSGVALVSVPTATSTTPKMDGTASAGSETTYAKGDHIHPSDTSKADVGHTHTKSDITDFSHTHTKSEITDFPTLATVATSGSYNDLSNTPSIHNVPSGGTKGQILTKDSSTDYDASWANPEVSRSDFEEAFPTDTASGAIASFPDGTDLFNAKSLKAEINPIQDLHGYDSPWVGGAGKNKVDISSATISSQSILEEVDLSAGTYTLSAYCTNNTSISGYLSIRLNGVAKGTITINNGDSNVRKNVTVTLTDSGTYAIVGSGATRGYNFSVSKVQLESGSSMTDFATYSNICPISGWDRVVVSQTPYTQTEKHTITGKNLFNAPNDYSQHLVACHIDANQSFVASASISCGIRYYDSNKTQIDYWSSLPNDYNGRKYRVISSATAIEYIEFYGSGSPTDLMIELGSTPSAYEPYGSHYTSTLPTTTYGGSVDIVKGVNGGSDEYYFGEIPPSKVSLYSDANGYYWYTTSITLDIPLINGLNDGLISNHLVKDVNISTTANEGLITCYANGIIRWKEKGGLSLDDYKTWLASNPLQICYKKATADTFSVTPTDVQILKGQNNIFADSGNVSVTYKADTQLWVEKKLSE